ncbi:MAG: sulfotransferase [Anaerolineae bacterium]|jgi:hypothetical protein
MDRSKAEQPIRRWFDAYLPAGRFDRPIFIIAPPRSGSTLLFECLGRFAGVYHLKQEADNVWWQLFPYQALAEPHDWVGRDQATVEKVEALRGLTYRAVVRHHFRGAPWPWRQLALLAYLGSGRAIRYLDKTIANCFHLEFLEQAFPGALYIFLVRDPRANISSMIDTWPHADLVGKPQLTPIIRQRQGATVGHWSFPAPPGWPAVLTEPLAQICAWSWQQHITYVLRFFDQAEVEPLWVRYEELIAEPWSTVKSLNTRLGLNVADDTRQRIAALPLSRTAVSRPAEDKWRQKHDQEIRSILPRVKDTARAIGYEV